MQNNGDETGRKMLDVNVAVDNTTPEHPVINWAKIIGLLFFTFGLIVVIWAIRYILTYY